MFPMMMSKISYMKKKSNDYEIESTINKITEDLDQNQKKLIKMSFLSRKVIKT